MNNCRPQAQGISFSNAPNNPETSIRKCNQPLGFTSIKPATRSGTCLLTGDWLAFTKCLSAILRHRYKVLKTQILRIIAPVIPANCYDTIFIYSRHWRTVIRIKPTIIDPYRFASCSTTVFRACHQNLKMIFHRSSPAHINGTIEFTSTFIHG